MPILIATAWPPPDAAAELAAAVSLAALLSLGAVVVELPLQAVKANAAVAARTPSLWYFIQYSSSCHNR
ncbi:MAG TPA: hypothetical protein VF802_08245 [Candidatus Limnocylindrales bacterium]